MAGRESVRTGEGADKGSMESPGVASVPRHRLADLAYSELKRHIVNGDLPMGERLVEAPLARSLGLSRAPVREAMRRLSEEGLTVEHPHQGTFVRELDVTSLIDLYNLRLGLEAVAIRLATRRRMPTTRLRELIDEMSKAARTGDHREVARQELAFHATLCEASGNAVLASVFEGIEGQILMAMSLDNAGFPDLDEVAQEHLPLVEAIESRDEAAAARSIQAHILSTLRDTIERLGGDPANLLHALPD